MYNLRNWKTITSFLFIFFCAPFSDTQMQAQQMCHGDAFVYPFISLDTDCPFIKILKTVLNLIRRELGRK